MDPPRELILRDTAAELGIDVSLEEIRRAYAETESSLRLNSSKIRTPREREKFYKTYNASLCLILGIEYAFDRLNPLLIANFGEKRRWVPYPDARDTLQDIASCLPVYVLANWDNSLEKLLEKTGLSQFFRDVYSSATLGTEKPSLACFSRFLERTGINASEAIYVGNEYAADIIGSRRAGFIPILVDREDEMPDADCIRVRSLSELRTAIIPIRER